MPDATFATPDVTTFCRLDELGLVVVGQHLQPDRAVLACRVADDAVEEADRWCRRCGCEGRPRDTVTRRLAHEPLGWRPTTLLLTIRRYRCTGCGHVWRQDTSRAAGPRAKLTRTALRWALVGLVRQHLSVARLAEALAVSWTTANSAVLAEGRRVLLADPARFDNVQVIGVDEHVVRHEALLFRMEVGDLDRFARRSGWVKLAAAWSSGNAGDGWEQPRQSQGGPALPDGPCLVSETGRCTQGTGVVKPLHRRPARTRWIGAGVRCVTARGVPPARRWLRVGNCRDGLVCRARQVVVKVCGVATTRPQGQSRAPRPSTGQQ